ncbi:MAG: DUF3152 domain-containing protein [Candidatus Saccharibacteria bacterium]|nr:DUF3152 domain-containing protein [Candidatus Saccharibacteria bacterium]
MKKLLAALFIFTCLATSRVVFAGSINLENKDELKAKLTAETINIKVPETIRLWPEATEAPEQIDDCNYAGFNEGNTGTTKVRVVNCNKIIYYQVLVWGNVEADINDFKAKVAETYKDKRGWSQIATFKEVTANPDFYLILSDAASLDATPGCSGDLSCTTWSNQVIINDLRWREGTEASRNAGMSTRDYQHMVINHETGHWLGHYAHIEGCDAGGPAPIMLQQSTGLRGCDSFNAWPLESELWTLR